MAVDDVCVPIRRALEGHLATFSEVPADRVQHENALFSPPEGEIYLRTKLDFNASLTAFTGRTFGVGASSRITGMFSVDVFSPSGVGTGDVERVVDNLLKHFQSGQVLTYGTHNVVLFVPRRESGVSGDTWYFVPCFMPWIYRTDQLSEA